MITLREALIGACTRMERARDILTDSNPRPECNWGLLDTKALRAALAQPDAQAQEIERLSSERDVQNATLANLRADLRECATVRDAEIERLSAALTAAIECVEAWAIYATPYFATKHDLAGDLARLREALNDTPICPRGQ